MPGRDCTLVYIDSDMQSKLQCFKINVKLYELLCENLSASEYLLEGSDTLASQKVEPKVSQADKKGENSGYKARQVFQGKQYP